MLNSLAATNDDYWLANRSQKAVLLTAGVNLLGTGGSQGFGACTFSSPKWCAYEMHRLIYLEFMYLHKTSETV